MVEAGSREVGPARTQNLGRHLAEDGAAADDPRLTRGVITPRLVHQTAVVPDHEIAGPPPVSMDARKCHDALVQCVDEAASLGIVHARNTLGMIPKKDALASGFRVRADHGMIDRWHRRALRLGHGILAVPAIAREVQIVNRAEPRELRPLRGIERVISRVHIGETRLAAARWDLLRVEHGGLTRGATPRSVRVPSHRATIGVLASGP